jgi:hypothetical protein
LPSETRPITEKNYDELTQAGRRLRREKFRKECGNKLQELDQIRSMLVLFVDFVSHFIEHYGIPDVEAMEVIVSELERNMKHSIVCFLFIPRRCFTSRNCI